MCVPGLCPGQQDVPLPGGSHAGAVLVDPAGCWAPWAVDGQLTSRVEWSECHLSPVTDLVPLSVPCCCLPRALLSPAPLLRSRSRPCSCPAPGGGGTEGHGEPPARSSHPWSVTASARGCMGSASLPKYSQGARASEGGVSWHQPLGGAGTAGSVDPSLPHPAARRAGRVLLLSVTAALQPLRQPAWSPSPGRSSRAGIGGSRSAAGAGTGRCRARAGAVTQCHPTPPTAAAPAGRGRLKLAPGAGAGAETKRAPGGRSGAAGRDGTGRAGPGPRP